MEEQLREHLMEDEQLLWTGRPEAFETFDKTNKTSIIVGLIVKVLVTLGILGVYIISVRETGTIKPGVIIVVLAFAIFAVLNPFLVVRRLRKKTLYGLTDKRVLRSGAYDEAVPYERIKSAVLRTDADGHTSLLCGSRAVPLKPWKWRGEADASFINSHEDTEASRVMFYAVPVDDKLEAILKKHLPLK